MLPPCKLILVCALHLPFVILGSKESQLRGGAVKGESVNSTIPTEDEDNARTKQTSSTMATTDSTLKLFDSMISDEPSFRQLNAPHEEAMRRLIKATKQSTKTMEIILQVLEQNSFNPEVLNAKPLLAMLNDMVSTQKLLKESIDNALVPSARNCERRVKTGAAGCSLGYSCISTAAVNAQGGKYWMPCGALTIKGQPGVAHKRLCPPMNIITSKAECMAAADQFQKEWRRKVKSGFPYVAGTTSDIKFRHYMNDDPHWKTIPGWTPHGVEPLFRPGAWHILGKGNPKGPLGCSLDPNKNVIYWNAYKMDQSPAEWEVGASYTEFGGLAHSGIDSRNVGICKGNA